MPTLKDYSQMISDAQYYNTMERVARENWKIWGDPSEEESLLRLLNSNEYDYRGFYGKYPNDTANASTHWPDEFKTVYHPTFSTDSRYSGVADPNYNPSGLIGGSWSPFIPEFFIPNEWQQRRKNKNKFDTGGITEFSLTPLTKTQHWDFKRKLSELEQGKGVPFSRLQEAYGWQAMPVQHVDNPQKYTIEDYNLPLEKANPEEKIITDVWGQPVPSDKVRQGAMFAYLNSDYQDPMLKNIWDPDKLPNDYPGGFDNAANWLVFDALTGKGALKTGYNIGKAGLSALSRGITNWAIKHPKTSALISDVALSTALGEGINMGARGAGYDSYGDYMAKNLGGNAFAWDLTNPGYFINPAAKALPTTVKMADAALVKSVPSALDRAISGLPAFANDYSKGMFGVDLNFAPTAAKTIVPTTKAGFNSIMRKTIMPYTVARQIKSNIKNFKPAFEDYSQIYYNYPGILKGIQNTPIDDIYNISSRNFMDRMYRQALIDQDERALGTLIEMQYYNKFGALPTSYYHGSPAADINTFITRQDLDTGTFVFPHKYKDLAAIYAGKKGKVYSLFAPSDLNLLQYNPEKRVAWSNIRSKEIQDLLKISQEEIDRILSGKVSPYKPLFTGKRYTVDQLAKIAKKKGYEGLSADNLWDVGNPTSKLNGMVYPNMPKSQNQIVIFNPEHILKSKNPIVYDDNGIIPLSRRFDKSIPNIYDNPKIIDAGSIKRMNGKTSTILPKVKATAALTLLGSPFLINWATTFDYDNKVEDYKRRKKMGLSNFNDVSAKEELFFSVPGGRKRQLVKDGIITEEEYDTFRAKTAARTTRKPK